MSLPRNRRLLARLLLAWFAVYLGTAFAAPAVEPVAYQLVCVGAGGVKLVPTGDGDADGTAQLVAGDHCPLCGIFIAPPVPLVERALPPAPDLTAPRVVAVSGAVPAASPPLPACGPPSSLR